ncbi:MAG: multicopper oxidase domain-containing protein [Synechococcaceae cyanobacterium]|nr:multicopper oxidase domain-containing protein [Synechococcaceae cyanobacterium]
MANKNSKYGDGKKMLSRRRFLETSALTASAAALPATILLGGRPAQAAVPYTDIEVPRPLDPSFIFTPRGQGKGPSYRIYLGETTQDLGLGGGNTTVWGYGNANNPSQAVTYPGRTFFVDSKVPITVRWDNELPKDVHLLDRNGAGPALDESLHWADPATGKPSGSTIDVVGPPIVTHLHGGQSLSNFDGLPEFWYTPQSDVKGPLYRTNQYNYPIDPEASTLWYHDHALGITRLNVYAGLAGFFIVTDDNNEQLIADGVLPRGQNNKYDIPLVIQDRRFTDNQLSLPTEAEINEADFTDAWNEAVANTPALDLDPDPAIPAPPDPSIQAEFFGDTILVNGKVWPKLSVEPTKYRLRLLNGSDSRFYVLRLLAPDASFAPFHVIATDQGFLNGGPVALDTLLIAPGERYEIIVDFTSSSPGDNYLLQNFGPDSPYTGEVAPGDLADPLNTGQIMKIVVVDGATDSAPNWSDSAQLRPEPFAVGNAVRTRKVALFEGFDEYSRLQPILGGEYTDKDGNPALRSFGWTQPITENPGVNDVEIWEIHNFTMDAHPIHLHLVAFEVLGRQEFSLAEGVIPIIQEQHDGSYGIGGKVLLDDITLGAARNPEAYENGPKDTVVALPGEITRIRMKFKKPRRYVWHCHILSHEDHEMMRPYHVGPIPGNSPEMPESLPPQ